MAVENEAGLVVREYYKSLYGEPCREAEFVAPSNRVIEVLKWSAEVTGEDVCIYTTIGASDYALGFSNEYFIGFAPEEDNVVFALAEIALHGNGSDSVPSAGDSITLSSDVWAHSEMTSFMFTEGSEIVSPFSNGDIELSFTQVIPLYPQELEFKRQNGEEALWRMFEAKAVEYWNPLRGNAVFQS